MFGLGIVGKIGNLGVPTGGTKPPVTDLLSLISATHTDTIYAYDAQQSKYVGYGTDAKVYKVSATGVKTHHYQDAATNSQIQSNDQTDVEWTATNVTTAQDETGLLGTANTACTLTATAANGTVIANPIVAASATHATRWWIKRKTGTGTIELTVDGGTTWQDVTSSIDSTFGTGITVDQATVTNPAIGIRIVTSADAVIIGNAESHLNTALSEIRDTGPIFTAGASDSTDRTVYRTADLSWFSQDKGAFYLEWTPAAVFTGGQQNNILHSGVTLNNDLCWQRDGSNISTHDGTNRIDKSYTSVADQTYKIGIAYDATEAKMRLNVDGTWGTENTYDGAFQLNKGYLELFYSNATSNGIRILDYTERNYAAAQAWIDGKMA